MRLLTFSTLYPSAVRPGGNAWPTVSRKRRTMDTLSRGDGPLFTDPSADRARQFFATKPRALTDKVMTVRDMVAQEAKSIICQPPGDTSASCANWPDWGVAGYPARSGLLLGTPAGAGRRRSQWAVWPA